MGDTEIPDELIDQLLGEYQGPEQLTGPDGLINQLRKRLIERAAGAELEQHLGYPPGGEPAEGQAKRRNGVSSKTLRTVDGPVTVDLPRDRDATFEPRIVPKHVRSFDGFDEQILALYAGGMTTREIQRHLRELYGVEVSDGLISEVTASIQDDVRAWQGRPLEELYVVVYLDAMQVSIRDQQVVRKKAVYVAIGVTLERDTRLSRPLDREDRGRPLLDERADRAPKPRRQGRALCLHRRPDRFPRGDRRGLPAERSTRPASSTSSASRCATSPGRNARAAPPSCAGSTPPPTPTHARQVLDELTLAWADSKTRTAALQVWERAWDRVIPFLAFPEEIRRIVYTTNTVESLHMQIRKTIKTRGHFPNDDAALQADLARNPTRQELMAKLLQLDAGDGSPAHPLRRPHP